MKLKKIGFAAMATTALLVVASCGNESAVSTTTTSDDSPATTTTKEVEADYISLENKNALGEIDADGYYTVGEAKIKTKNVYKTTYSTEPTGDKFNYLKNQWQYNSEQYTNMVDGLVENDQYSNIVGALATSYKTKDNADGTQTWTFKLREGVKWVDNETGEEVATVTADDFVAGLEYVLDPINGSSTVGIVESVIAGATEYYEGLNSTDDASDDKPFSSVGVKAIDDYTLEYTLNEATPYFLTNLTYSPFLPVNRDYLDDQGTEFGTSKDHILVNGAFRMTESVTESKIVFTKNEKYWDKQHVYIDTVEEKFVPGTATSSDIRSWYESGVIDGFTVNSKDTVGYKKYVTGEDGTGTLQNPASSECNGVLSLGDATYTGYYNFARTTYEYSDPSDNKTDAQKAATTKAVCNKNFRKGILYGFKVEEYLKMVNEYQPLQYLMRGYTIKELCVCNGKDYVDYVNDVFNEKEGTTGVSVYGIENGSDPVYNATKAGEFFATAKTELLAAGLTEADFPIQLDVVGAMDVETQAYEKAAYKTIEDSSNGLIKICYNVPSSDDQYTNWGSESNNYDFSMYSGWGPDYADPKTFLNTYAIGGDSVMYLGFTEEDEENIALEKEILGAYDELYRKAVAITDNLDERYKAMAEAEYALIYEEAIIIPWYTKTGYYATVSRVVPYQADKATYGLSADKLKNVIVSENVIDQATRTAVKAAYDSKK